MVGEAAAAEMKTAVTPSAYDVTQGLEDGIDHLLPALEPFEREESGCYGWSDVDDEIERAVDNYESFHNITGATLDQVSRSSAGVQGWAAAGIAKRKKFEVDYSTQEDRDWYNEKMKDYKDLNVRDLNLLARDVGSPATYDEAVSHPILGDHWKKSSLGEAWQLLRYGTVAPYWGKDDPPALKTKEVYKTKALADGYIDKLKSRETACGYAQILGKHYYSSYAPVADRVSIKIVLHIAATEGMDSRHLDVTGAFLKPRPAPGTKTFIRTPACLRDHPRFAGVKKCLLTGGLYGTKDAANLWHKEADEKLKALGYSPTVSDPCVYVRHEPSGNRTMAALYVDDIFLFSHEIDRAVAEIEATFEIGHSAPLEWVLNTRVTHDRSRRLVLLDQENHVHDMLKQYGHSQVGMKSVPLPSKLSLSSAELDADDYEVQGRRRQMQQRVGSLNYLAGSTRPDISFAVAKLGQHTSKPPVEALSYVKRTFGYLRQHPDMGIVLGGDQDMVLESYADADFADCVDTRRTQAGEAHYLGGRLICWRSWRMKRVMTSTHDAELTASSVAVKRIIHFRRLLAELGYPQQEPTTLWSDNQAAVTTVHGHNIPRGSKHAAVRVMFVREHHNDGTINYRWKPGAEQLADWLTKSLPGPKFKPMLLKTLISREEFLTAMNDEND